VARRLAFVIYGVWKSNTPYAEGNPVSFEKKRERLLRHAKAITKRPNVQQLIGELLSRPAPSGASG
jgi:hypothetical protein